MAAGPDDSTGHDSTSGRVKGVGEKASGQGTGQANRSEAGGLDGGESRKVRKRDGRRECVLGGGGKEKKAWCGRRLWRCSAGPNIQTGLLPTVGRRTAQRKGTSSACTLFVVLLFPPLLQVPCTP